MKIVPVTANTTIINETKKGIATIAQKAGKITPRKLPNCIGAVDEMYGVTGSGHVKFFAEDLAQMADMSVKERLDFKKKLIEAGRYYE